MDDSSLSKEEIIQLIKSHDARLTFEKPKRSSSQVWSTFSYVRIDNRKQDFVSCETCKDILHHKSIDGTSSMMKHQKICAAAKKNSHNNSLSIKEYFRPKTTQPIPKKFKEQITNATVEFVSLDNRAFELVSGDGFIHLAQTIFDVGQDLYKSQGIDVLDLLPNPTTVSRNIDRLYVYRKSQLIKLCQKMKSYTIVVDFWTDSHTGISYCGIGLSRLNDDLILQVFILGCFPYDRDNQSSNQIRQFVDSKLMDFHLSLDNSKFLVSDNENKMKSAFKDACIRIGCAIHYVNKQLEHCFATNIVDKVPVKCEIVQQMFAHIRKIVSHTRRAHKQSKLSRKLQSYSDTRFNGAFYTMNVFLVVFDELVGVLDRTLLNNYELIDKDLLSYVCTFLKPFDEILEQLSSDTKPTIYKVLPFKQYLLNQCKIHPDDHDGIQQIKTFLEKRLQDVWVLHDVHYITTLLHPSFKNLHINPILREKAVDLAKKELLKRQPSTSYTSCTTIVESSGHTRGLDLPSTNTKSLLSQCFDMPKSDSTLAPTPYDELEEYITLNVQLNESDDILSFWLHYKFKFPILFSIVQDFYAIPASNTIVERLFSSSKSTITDKRTSLGAEKVNKLLFLKKNLKLLKEIHEQSINEVGASEMKRKMIEESSHTGPSANQERLSTTTATKKFKVVDEESILFCDDDEENDGTDLF